MLMGISSLKKIEFWLFDIFTIVLQCQNQLTGRKRKTELARKFSGIQGKTFAAILIFKGA